MPHSLALLGLDWSTAISLVALAIALLSYRRSGAADRRDRERHELTLAEAAASRQAELALKPLWTEGLMSSEPRVHVRNIGPATARDVTAWLVDDDDERHSTVAETILMLAPNDAPVEVRVSVDELDWNEAELHLLRWRVAWTDGNGPHEATTEWRPPGDESIEIF